MHQSSRYLAVTIPKTKMLVLDLARTKLGLRLLEVRNVDHLDILLQLEILI